MLSDFIVLAGWLALIHLCCYGVDRVHAARLGDRRVAEREARKQRYGRWVDRSYGSNERN